MIGSALIVLVAVWLAITLLAQLRTFAPAISSKDPFHLVPRWTFFAPNPGIRDYHLIIRDKNSDGVLHEWLPVPISPARPRIAFVWNPPQRQKKIVSDAIQSLKRQRQFCTNCPDSLTLSLPYLCLLHAACSLAPISPRATERQFAIVESSGHDDRKIWVSFLSRFHPL